MENKLIYTVGHSNQEIEEFRSLIQTFDINCIVDVRSVPASAYTPQFNQDNLKYYLRQYNIVYLHFGKEFGARRNDCLDDNGYVNFEKAIDTTAFKYGVQRLITGLNKGFRIALMCSEAAPIECHRFALVSRYFYERGFNVKHILKDKSIVDNAILQKEMVDIYVKEKKIRDINDIFATMENYDERCQIILKKYHVKKIIDIRINNTSQLAGFAKGVDLSYFAQQICGIEYTHIIDFAPTKELLSDYQKKNIDWKGYQQIYRKLIENRKIAQKYNIENFDGACFLCSEETPEQCHRRLLVEYFKELYPTNINIVHIK